MRKLALVLVALCLVAGMSSTARAVPFSAHVGPNGPNSGGGPVELMTLTVFTYTGAIPYDVVVMVYNEESWNWEVNFAPNPAATNWRVEATLSGWYTDPVIICGNNINWIDNELGEDFNYIGPLR